MTTDFLETLQDFAEARINANATLAAVPVIAQRKNNTLSDLQRALGVLSTQAGKKIGACIVVLMPSLQTPDPNIPGPRFDVSLSIMVFEHPQTNGGSVGTGLSAEQIAVEVLQLFHHWSPLGATVWTAAPGALAPDDSVEGLRSYVVQLQTFAGLSRPARTMRPAITATATAAPATVSLSCSTSGATIRYTLDNSYPWAGNSESIRYSAPFSVTESLTITAAAESTGAQQSDIAILDI